MEIRFIGLCDKSPRFATALDRRARRHGWNHKTCEAGSLIEKRMNWADTPRAVADRSQPVFSIVNDGEAVRSAAGGGDCVIFGLVSDHFLLGWTVPLKFVRHDHHRHPNADLDVVLAWGWSGAGTLEDPGYEAEPR